jgi:hypothetical protein
LEISHNGSEHWKKIVEDFFGGCLIRSFNTLFFFEMLMLSLPLDDTSERPLLLVEVEVSMLRFFLSLRVFEWGE